MRLMGFALAQPILRRRLCHRLRAPFEDDRSRRIFDPQADRLAGAAGQVDLRHRELNRHLGLMVWPATYAIVDAPAGIDREDAVELLLHEEPPCVSVIPQSRL